MKATYLYAAGALALTTVIAACVAGPDLPPPVIAPSPTVTAQPAPPPTPVAPPPVQEPRYDNYLDAPQTPGTWRYTAEPDETLGMYVSSETGPAFVIRCARGQVSLARFMRAPARQSLAMEIKTETTTRIVSAEPIDGRPLVAATVRAGDSLLDAMAITKGRIAIGVEGERTLYLPAWVEISRVIEDCR